ncbi:tRNA (N6-threonylcarbamoyladenosine(37)-N6)-methyltransferase TrmO [Saccharicrinis fermentans]|nr:tRNA (N6-threonylcarbamoyladenosine(37)-N6)-methyltransferase TrmO [Saccharicrinis fermentans]
MNHVTFEYIGTIYTPYQSLDNMPIQPSGAKDAQGYILINDEFVEGLKDMDGFSHITLIYHLNKVTGHQLSVVPYMDDKAHGVFATRSPKRPNAIGLSTVKLERVEGNKLFVREVDMLNETPLLDIKPFFRQADNRMDATSGWLEKKDQSIVFKTKSDDRFVD